ncbi:hypothetical protein D9M68_396090 [compost metagenome]
MKPVNPFKYLIFYIPFILSWVTYLQPHFSYLVAWTGSFFIFFFSYNGYIKPLPKDLKFLNQFLRPIFLVQLIFVGYMACTSIFYYVNALGYEYFNYIGPNYKLPPDLFEDIARCQRYYVLGHAALVTGMFVKMKYPVALEFRLFTPSMSNLLLGISLFSLPIGYILGEIGALKQFSLQVMGLSFVSGTIALAFAIKENKKVNLYLSLFLFGSNLVKAMTSGFKEPIIVCFLLLGVFLFPVYGKKIIPIFIAVLIGLIAFLPTFIGNYRKIVSDPNNPDYATARNQSLEAIINNDNLSEDLREDNWAFLTMRFSEIDMFIKFTKSTPRYVPYYRFEIAGNAIKSIVPRFLWPWKPDMEPLIMERAYKANIVDQRMNVSAKPAYIVDCYLSYGMIGIWLGLFLYGYIAQWLSQKAEALFGGYFMGTAVVFTGLFQLFWRGNSFEIIFNNIFWAFIGMYIISEVLRARGILERLVDR